MMFLSIMLLFSTKTPLNHPHLIALCMLLLTINATATVTPNLLCFNDEWNIIKGSWDFDPITCSLTNTDLGDGNIVWFGSTDGQTHDYKYDFDIFVITAVIEITSGNNAGILFRTTKSSAINDEGPSYQVGIGPSEDTVFFGELNNGWITHSQTSFTIDSFIQYKVEVMVSNAWYHISVDDNVVINWFETSSLSRGAIGLRTYQATTKFHSLIYEPLIQLESCNTDNHYIRYQDGNLEMSNDDSSNQFVLRRPGLVNDIDYITLRVGAEYVRHSGAFLKLDPDDDTELFEWDASYKMEAALNGNGECISLRSFNHPTYFISVVDSTTMKIDPFVDSTEYKDDASFRIQNFKVPTTAPTATPTNIPTFATTGPTRNPTPAPTFNPTPAPTANPTHDPTPDPTLNPTHDPTSDPTTYPTIDPTIDPTMDPTTDPTTDPSNAPSLAPSDAPSIAPTSSPTTCYEQDDIFSNDGTEHSIYDKLLGLRFINIVENVSKINDAFEEGLYFSKALVFRNDDTQEMRCRGYVSCLYSSILIENNFISNILCNGPYSCPGASINIKNTKNIQIICNGTQSCSDMILSIDSAINSDIKIDCGVAGSCTDLHIDVVGNNNNVQINCIDINSCDGLYTVSDASNYQNVKLNMFSYSNNVTFANGFGFEELNTSTQYVECNTHNKWMKWNTSWTSPNEYIILSEYINNQFPCNDIKIDCFENNITDIISSCSMQYHIKSNPFNITGQSTQEDADCYWVELKDIFLVSCDGDCVSSPTYDPTMAPTASPTEPTSDPTKDPTTEPTIYPTSNPTTDPTIDPTLDPTGNPTIDPTVDPTIDPTRDPTEEPTHDPTKDPTMIPTLDPTVDPTTDPTNDPTTDPTIAPSHAPTTPPSNAPSAPPTKAPSYSPTQAPSTPPTGVPSNNPTYSPSAAPTRVPTIDIDEAYDTFIIVQYYVYDLSVSNKQFVVSNTVESVGKMEEIIESNYFNSEILSYTDFFANILTINDKNVEDNVISTNAEGTLSSTALSEYDLDINNIEHRPMSLQCRIECDSIYSGFIITTTFTESFVTRTEKELIRYFENDNITFVVESDELRALSKNPYNPEEPEDTTALKLSIIIVSAGFFISFLAFIYNKLESTKVDNAAFFMPFLISLNIYDFMSDINLSAIIIATALLPEYAGYTSLMFWLALMSIVFILLPFSSNLLYAMRIRRQRAIKDNPSARVYFGTHLAQFILLCVFCAGTYPVLGLTSSRLFGLEIFDAGLLSSEMHQLSKIKIRSTIYFENCPQLLIQILYTVITAKEDGIKTATYLAFIASLLSVVASVIIYQAQKDVSDEFIVETYFIRLYHHSIISKTDRDIITVCKGLKAKLGGALCRVFNISHKSIEIGYVTVNDHGLIVHLQQQIYKEELDTLKKKLLSDSNIAMPSTGYVIDITPDMYIERLFDIHRMKILNAFVEHFRVSERKKEFEVSYHKHIEDANDYDDGNVSNDIDVEGNDDDLLVAFKQKITVMASKRNVFNNDMATNAPIPIGRDEEELSDIEEDEKKGGEMLEMTGVTTNGQVRSVETNDEFNAAFQKLQLNLEAKMQQQLQLNLEKQMELLGRMVRQHIDGNDQDHTEDVMSQNN